MTEAKDIDDSLEYLRYFEKYTENPDLADLVQEKLSIDKTKLDLRSCALQEEDFKLLAEMKPLAQLKSLVLNQTNLTSAGLKHLCFSPIIQQLETLHLANNNLDDEGIFYLSKSPVFTQLQDLSLTGNEIGALGAKVFFSRRKSAKSTYSGLVIQPHRSSGDQGTGKHRCSKTFEISQSSRHLPGG